MGVRLISLAIALIVSVVSVGYTQPVTTNQNRETPDIRVQVWGYIVADFSTRVWDYFELRSELEKGLPALTVTDDPERSGGRYALSQKGSVWRALEQEKGTCLRRPSVLSSGRP